MNNSGDSVFGSVPAGDEEAALFGSFLGNNDFSPNTRKAFSQDLRKFANWFVLSNHEPFRVGRVTTRDVSDFRDQLRRERRTSSSDG